MKVLLDAQAAVGQRAGVGRYAKCLAEALARHIDPDELELFWFDLRGREAPIRSAGVTTRVNRWMPRRLVQAGWEALDWPPFDWFSGPANVYHFPNFVRPPLATGRSVVTVHDVAFLRFPETGEPRNVRYLSARVRRSVRRADAVITDSGFVAAEVRELLGVPADRVHPIAIGGSIRPPAGEEVDATLRRIGIDAPYLLHVGTLEPRKNIPFLVDVFERLERFDGLLVVAGQRGWKDEPILRRLAESGRADRILRLGFVADEDLPALYAGAELFVFPTLYEGFGLPPLEAMACGTPVVAAAVASIPEVVGEAGTLVAEHDVDRWVAEIERALGDTELRARLARVGIARAAEFTWDRTARETLRVYRSVHGAV